MDHLVRASHGSYLGVHFPGEVQTALRAAAEPPGRWAVEVKTMLLLFKNVLFTLMVPGTVAVYLPLRIARNRQLVTGPAFGAGCLLLLLGASLYAWCVWDFATFGRGTPAPIDAPKKLVVRGLYRYTRNPMYIGVLTVIVGWAMLFGAFELVLYALVVGACFESFIVFFEEPHLRAEFGSDYEEYCARVSRWRPRLPGPLAV